MSGLATWCNRVGHHRGKERDEAGNLIPMPFDHWEAELIVGMTQLALTYGCRLRDSGILSGDPPATAAPGGS